MIFLEDENKDIAFKICGSLSEVKDYLYQLRIKN